MDKIPTLEEYRQAVVDLCKKNIEYDSYMKPFLESGDADDIIKHEYENALIMLQKGKIGIHHILDYCASRAEWCIFMSA